MFKPKRLVFTVFYLFLIFKMSDWTGYCLSYYIAIILHCNINEVESRVGKSEKITQEKENVVPNLKIFYNLVHTTMHIYSGLMSIFYHLRTQLRSFTFLSFESFI